MQITFFGFLWCGVIILAFFQNDFKKMLGVTLFSMIMQCNNIIILNGTGVGVQIFTACIACVRLLFEPNDKRKGSKPTYMVGLFVLLLISILISMWLNDVWEEKQMIPFMVLIAYTVLLILLSYKKIVIDEKWLTKVEDIIITTVLVVGFLQVLNKLGVLPIEKILTPLIYNDVSNTDVIFNHKSTYRFYSTFMEPSYCGAFLVGLFALVSLREKLDGKNILLCIFLSMAIILTRASTAYGGLVITIAVIFFVRAKKKVYKFILPLLLIAGFGIIVLNPELLNEVIFEKSNTGSFSVRENWNEDALEKFNANPFFGSGFRVVRASSLFYSILGEIGLFGMTIYALILLYFLMIGLIGKKSNNLIAHAILIIGVAICQLIACPDLTLSPFWLSLFWFVLAYKARLRSNKWRISDEK